MEISSHRNPIVKKAASLKEKKYRDAYGHYLIEGVKTVTEAFKFGAGIGTVFCTEDNLPAFRALTDNIITVSESVCAMISDSVTPQGVVAIVKKPDNRLIPPLSDCILLDTVQDPGNVGTIIRTAVAAGIPDIYLIDSADPFSPKAVRASMSGIFNISVHTGGAGDILPLIKNLPVIAADMDGESVFTFSPPKNFCLAIGSEGRGLSSAVFSAAKYKVSIPMTDKMESLNAGVSASVIMYQLKNKGA